MTELTTQERNVLTTRLFARRLVDAAGCWRYTGATTSNGYGWMGFRGGNEYAHRISAMIYLWYIPESGLHVCHDCDTPPCFNPDHLFIGTALQNMTDAATKGRMVGKKLSATHAGQIKYLLRKGATQRAISQTYNVSVTAIGQIARGVTWRDAPDLAPPDEDADSGSGAETIATRVDGRREARRAA